MEINKTISLGHWNLGHVIKLYPGADGLVRDVDVQLPTSVALSQNCACWNLARRLHQTGGKMFLPKSNYLIFVLCLFFKMNLRIYSSLHVVLSHPADSCFAHT